MGWVTIHTKIKTKLAPKAIKCTMIGYARDHTGDTYRMYNPVTRRVIQTREIRWDDWTTPTPANGIPKDKSGIDEDFFAEFDLDEVVQVRIPATHGAATPKQPAQTAILRDVSKAGRKIPMQRYTLSPSTEMKPEGSACFKKFTVSPFISRSNGPHFISRQRHCKIYSQQYCTIKL